MKRISIPIAALLLCASLAWAGDMQLARMSVGVVVGAGGGATACTTPTTGDIMHEGFLGAGYELGAAWSETGTGTIDEDASLPGTPPSGSCTEGLHVVASDSASKSRWDNGSTISRAQNIDIHVPFYIDSYTLASGSFPILYFQNNATAGIGILATMKVYLSGGVFKFACEGASTSTLTAVSADAWHEVTMHLDATAASSTCTLDGTATGFQRNDANDPRYLFLGAPELAAGQAIDIYFGRVYVDTP